MIRLAATLLTAGVRTVENAVKRAVDVAMLRGELAKANARVAVLERQVTQLTADLDLTRRSNLECLRRESMLRRKRHQETGEPC